jgi:hypothetical protein
VNTAESLRNLRVQTGRSSERIEENRMRYSKCVNKPEAPENVHYKPEGVQNLRKETESSVEVT